MTWAYIETIAGLAAAGGAVLVAIFTGATLWLQLRPRRPKVDLDIWTHEPHPGWRGMGLTFENSSNVRWRLARVECHRPRNGRMLRGREFSIVDEYGGLKLDATRISRDRAKRVLEMDRDIRCTPASDPLGHFSLDREDLLLHVPEAAGSIPVEMRFRLETLDGRRVSTSVTLRRTLRPVAKEGWD